MAKGIVDFINKLPYVKHKTGDITHWTPIHFTEDSPAMIKDQEIEFEVKEGMAYRVIQYNQKKEFTAKEIGEKLFKIHSHEIIDQWTQEKQELEAKERIIYYEEDIINLLQELGHPAPDWNWDKNKN